MKHGLRSRRTRRAVEKIISDPDIRSLLLFFSSISDPLERDRYRESLERIAATVAGKRRAAARKRSSST
jgi:hypothetical protein